jgi:GNAT superfamily N-acetyltransferase
MVIKVDAVTGTDLVDALPMLGRLRVAVFREWPYLYDGTEEYERRYFEKFAAARDTILVVARDGGEIVGASTASPLTGHADEFADGFRAKGLDPAGVYYFGESVLLPAYRGQGIGHSFFGHREARARYFGRFTHAAFCSVIRPSDHPLRPNDYHPLDHFWRSRGYQPVDGLTAEMTWKDVDKPAPSKKSLQFWMRAL